MPLVRPRLTEHYDVSVAQASVPFAIPFLNEDLPLYVDPFLLWKSPSQQDYSLHVNMMHVMNQVGRNGQNESRSDAIKLLVWLSECEEVGLGTSATRAGKRISEKVAGQIVDLFGRVPRYKTEGMGHIEEIQLLIDGISRDRISDFTCNLVKSFLIDFSIEESERIGLPLSDVVVPQVFDVRSSKLQDVRTKLPVHPETKKPLLLVPKRWLRFAPWISYDEYFQEYIPKDERFNTVTWDRVSLLSYNRDNYGVVEEYVKLKERTAADCVNDPLFKQIPIISAKRKLSEIKKLPAGRTDNADQKYEDAVTSLLASMFYPDLDFADTQARTDGGSHIRDLIFYNNRSIDFLADVERQYDSRQLVFELKNVAKVEGEHINQVHRYLGNEFGRFGVIVTRNGFPSAIWSNVIGLWNSKRVSIVPITDMDLETMVDIFEQKGRSPVDVLKRAYLDFTKRCPV